MASLSPRLWTAIESVVQQDRYGGANEQFSDFHTAVLKATDSELQCEVGRAQMGLTFVLLFAEKKPMYRARVVKILERLMAEPGWRQSYETTLELQQKATSLHADIQAVLVQHGTPVSSGTATAAPQFCSDSVGGGYHASKTQAENDRDAKFASRLAALANDSPTAGRGSLSTGFESGISQVSVASAASQETTEVVVTVPPVASAVASGERAGDDGRALIRAVRPFLQRAEELRECEPLVAYYCRVHAADILMRERLAGNRGEASDALLHKTMAEAEKEMLPLDLTGGKEKMMVFAFRAFENANAADIAGKSRTAPLQLYLSGLFLEVLTLFHDSGLPPEIAALVKYSKSRSVYLRNCESRCLEPEAPSPPPVPAVPAAK
eukprot:TRINITY_DN44394_c0_g1_i1.p1 TRINITY_DN44394_c0_g1~~TRINITY_DN44394_c0_g1_i1.p1  ORF type:complete len:380 (+),score=80.20 TRINITY_DN44394_c0_g1_i1:114-1253(+)